MKKVLLSLLLSSLLLTGCNQDFVEKTSETLSRGVYATADALNEGRIDLASSYINDLESLVPIPKNRIKISPVISNGVSYVVLTDNLKGTTVVIVGSKDFNDLVSSKAILQKDAVAFKEESDKQAKINAQVQSDLLKNNNDLKKEVIEYHDSLEYKVKHFWLFAEISTPIIIAGLVALCFFFPPALPIIASAVGTILGFLTRIISGLFSFALSFFNKPTTN